MKILSKWIVVITKDHVKIHINLLTWKLVRMVVVS